MEETVKNMIKNSGEQNFCECQVFGKIFAEINLFITSILQQSSK